MCGIVGFTGSDKQLLERMLSSIEHRGPDGQGTHLDDKVSLGMRRLAIIDPNTGWQPIWNKDNSRCIIFNGEIYNYADIRKELVKSGMTFRTDHSDTETVLLGYELWKEDILKKLRGMFAFAIYDVKKNELFIARDRLGIKPLYYYQQNDVFYFASEIKALLQIPGYKRRANKQSLFNYLKYRVHDADEKTFFEGINRLDAAHYIKVNSAGKITSKNKYWNPEVNFSFNSKKSDSEYANELREIYVDTVRMHLVSDVPVGISLSGGLDSTGVAAITKQLIEQSSATIHTDKMHTFSVIYPDASMNEENYIDIAADFVKSEKHIIKPTVDAFWQEIEDWVYTQEEPTISSGPYANYNVMREASKYVKVMLSGQGGDELFAGYIPYFSSYIQSALEANRYDALAREFLKGADLYFPYLLQVAKKKIARSKSVQAEDLISSKVFAGFKFGYTPSKGLNQRLFEDLTKYSVPNLLRYEDKNSMRFSVEGRVPFLDHVLVEYILTLPVDQKIKNGWNRYVYRNALVGFLPKEIEKRRKKVGFTTPESDWMRQKADRIIKEFSSEEFSSLGLFSQKKVISEFKAWAEGRNNSDPLLFWRVLNVHLWAKIYNISV